MEDSPQNGNTTQAVGMMVGVVVLVTVVILLVILSRKFLPANRSLLLPLAFVTRSNYPIN